MVVYHSGPEIRLFIYNYPEIPGIISAAFQLRSSLSFMTLPGFKESAEQGYPG